MLEIFMANIKSFVYIHTAYAAIIIAILVCSCDPYFQVKYCVEKSYQWIPSEWIIDVARNYASIICLSSLLPSMPWW